MAVLVGSFMESWCSSEYKGGISRVRRLHGSSSLTVAVRFHQNRWLRVHSQVIFIVIDQHEKWSDNVKLLLILDGS